MPTLRAGTLTRTDSSGSGFTLLEVIVVLCTMGLMVGLALPLIGSRDPLKEAARQIGGTIDSLRDAAVFSKETYRLYFDMDQQIYWATVWTRDGERISSHADLANGISLRHPVRISEVASSRRGRVSVGRAFLELRPDGRVDPAVILLSDEDAHVLSLKVDRLSGHVRIAEHANELNPLPISPSLLSLLQPLPPASPKPRM